MYLCRITTEFIIIELILVNQSMIDYTVVVVVVLSIYAQYISHSVICVKGHFVCDIGTY